MAELVRPAVSAEEKRFRSLLEMAASLALATPVFQSARAAMKDLLPPEPPTERALLKKMAAHGGEFARALAAAWMLADPHNAECLRASFGGMLARYEGAPDQDNCGIPRAFNGGDQT